MDALIDCRLPIFTKTGSFFTVELFGVLVWVLGGMGLGLCFWYSMAHEMALTFSVHHSLLPMNMSLSAVLAHPLMDSTWSLLTNTGEPRTDDLTILTSHPT
jgi:hypothetical protein